MPKLSRLRLLLLTGLLGCDHGSSTMAGRRVDGGHELEVGATDAARSTPAAAARDASGSDELSFHWHCARSHAKSAPARATVEEIDGKYWFCGRSVELESKHPIQIITDSLEVSEEFDDYELEIDGARLHVRVDSEWADLQAHGWKAEDIEQVVYPEVFGRSARKAVGGRIRREADLIYSTYNIMRVHVRYDGLTIDQSAIVDLMIDRAHVPFSDGSRTLK